MAQQIAQYVNAVLDTIKQLGGSGQPSEVCSIVARKLGVKEAAQEVTPDGRTRLEKRIHWVRWHLVKAGFLDRSKRGVWTLTEKGRTAQPLSEEQAQELVLNVQREDLVARVLATAKTQAGETEETIAEPDAEDEGYAAELLKLLRELPHKGFERLCQWLLREAGFQQVVVTGRSGDGGIDGHGVLRVNPFVTFKVLFQCKRYTGKVGAPEIRDFRGAMQGRADKGIIITTGAFTTEADKEATRDGVPPIELVDGERLVALFAELEFGLTPRATYDVDYHFFEQFRTTDSE